MTEAQETRRRSEFEEQLAYRRAQLGPDLGVAAVTILTGGAIHERVAVDYTPERPEIHEQAVSRMAHIAVADTGEIRRPVVSAPLDSRALEGYALAA